MMVYVPMYFIGESKIKEETPFKPKKDDQILNKRDHSKDCKVLIKKAVFFTMVGSMILK